MKQTRLTPTPSCKAHCIQRCIPAQCRGLEDIVTASSLTRRLLLGPSLLGAVFVVLWGSAWIAGKFALHSTGPLTLLVIRFGVAGLVLLPIALLTGAKWPRKAADYGHLAIAGVLVNAATLAGIYLGLSLGVSSGTSALVAGTAPIFTALGAGPVLDERIERRQWLGMLIGLAGVALVVLNKVSPAGGGWEGYALTFASLAAFVAGTLYQKRFASAINLSSGNFVQFAVATVAVLPLAVRFEGLHAQWDRELIASALWMAIANSVCGLGLLYFLLRRGKASQVSTLFLLVPAVTAVMGFLAFHETLGPVALGGFALAAGGVFLGSRSAKAEARSTVSSTRASAR